MTAVQNIYVFRLPLVSHRQSGLILNYQYNAEIRICTLLDKKVHSESELDAILRRVRAGHLVKDGVHCCGTGL